MIPTTDHTQRAQELIDRVKHELAPLWLGGRQRMILEHEIAKGIADTEGQEREAIITFTRAYFGGIAASHAWFPLNQWVTQVRQRASREVIEYGGVEAVDQTVLKEPSQTFYGICLLCGHPFPPPSSAVHQCPLLRWQP